MSIEPPEDRSSGEDLPFGSLAEGPQPSDDLEARTVRALRERGLIAPGSAPAWTVYLKVAAALVAVVLLYSAGFMSQRILEAPRAASMEAPGYMLLLWESDAMLATTEAAGEIIVKEYTAWAAGQAEQGRLLGGEQLGKESRFVRRGEDSLVQETTLQAPEEQNLSGYFLITASGQDEALEIAANCPHLEHGGTIEIRRIVRR